MSSQRNSGQPTETAEREKMTKDLLSSHPKVVAADQALADCNARLAEFEGRAAKIREEDEVEIAAYNAAAAEALRTGSELPRRPIPRVSPTVDQDVRAELWQEREQLQRARVSVLAELYPEILQKARKGAAGVAAVAAQHVEALRELRGQLVSILGDVTACRDSQNALDADDIDLGRKIFNDRRLDLELLIELVSSGAPLVDSVLDLDGSRPPDARGLGLSGADSLHRMAEARNAPEPKSAGEHNAAMRRHLGLPPASSIRRP